jgi:hypothetical protein
VKSFISTAFFMLAIALFVANASAQQASNPPFDFPAHVDVPGEKTSEGAYLEMVRRNTGGTRSEGPSREPRVLKQGLLAPPVRDSGTYRVFLSQANTGLVRLLPREIYDWRTYHTRQRLKTNGGGAYYSFHYLSHEYGFGSDISLDHNQISAGGFGGTSYGMLTGLGKIDLAAISANDPRVTFMTDYRPAVEDALARCEYSRFGRGVTAGSNLYKRTLPVDVGSTYLLRSINYGTSDVLVAFRIIRQDTDGSIIILWQLLKQYTPIRSGRVLYVNNSNKCPIR